MNGSTLGIVAAAVAVLLGLNIYQFVDNQSLRDELADMKKEPGSKEAARGSGTGSDPRLAGTDPGSTSKSRPRKERRVPALTSKSKPDDPKGKNPGEVNLADAFANMADNPAIKQQMKAQMEVMVMPAFKDLYGHLDLDETETAYFKKLIMDKFSSQQAIGMKMMGAAGDPEKAEAIKKELKEAGEASDAQIKDFLNNDEDYAYFESYQKQLPDRMELQQYSASFEESNAQLSPDQKNQLLDFMSEERTNSQLGDVNDPKNWDMENFNEDTITEVITKMEDFHGRVEGRADGVLNEQQLEVLATSQEQHRKMQQFNMTMGLQFFKAAKQSANSPEE